MARYLLHLVEGVAVGLVDQGAGVYTQGMS